MTRNRKVWNGTAGNINWATATNWIPAGVPTATDCVLIPNTGGFDPVINGTTDAFGYTLTVENNGALTQQSNSTLTIGNTVTVQTDGLYTMEASSSLIQIENVNNTVDGTFTMDRTANIRNTDYVYWSTPVTNFNIQNVSPTTPNGYKYEWIPTANQGPGPVGIPTMLFGEWQSYNSGAMDVGKGYIIKGPTGHPSTPSAYTAIFSGTPNNGTIVQPIERSTYIGVGYTYQPNPGGR